MKVLIAGGAGFLGANLVRHCLARPGVDVTVLDSLESRLYATTDNLKAVWQRVRFIRGSLLDDTAVAAAVQGMDLVLNCAAQTSHPLSIQQPLYDAELNCLGNLKLLENLRQLNRGAVVVYASSSTVIGKAAGEIVDETHGEKPLDIYSANKAVAEKYYRIYHRVHDMKTVAVRFPNLYGPYGKGRPEFGFVNYFADLARRGEEIRIFGEGRQTRNVLYAEDAAEAMWLAGRTPGLFGETWFAAHEEHMSVADIAAGIVRVIGRGSVTHVPWPDERRRIEVDAVQISSERFRESSGWAPRHSFEQGLRRMKAVWEDGAA